MLKQDLLSQNLVGNGLHALDQALRSEEIFWSLRDVSWPKDLSFGLNLQWPSFSNLILPQSSFYLISFHTEQFDCCWLRDLALKQPHSQIMILYDGWVTPSGFWPKNCYFYRWVTWAQQLANVINCWGTPRPMIEKQIKISALCHRQTQFKTYVIGLLLQELKEQDRMCSWHATRDMTTDNHVWTNTTGRHYLDDLACYMHDRSVVKADDWFDQSYNYPMQNSDWNHPAYTQCVFNCTNESFHYSFTYQDGIEMIYPGPYLTEKTWKPLLAGTGVFAIGQYHTYHALREVGFKFDYGINLGYDDVSRDLDRIEMCLKSLHQLIQYRLEDLIEINDANAKHNQHHILTGELTRACEIINAQTLVELQLTLG